ncbi:MAG TPA: bile acid:sodium symporter family protein [Myxococcaceae bacterium]|nr:bile acid:sodium symporter family protein [Myxococcaceae bacterium]
MDEVVLAIEPDARRLLAGLLALIMFSVALGLRPRDFREVLQRPRPVLVGLVAQVLALPALTLLLSLVLAPTPSIALGMIVVAACPGGNVSNFLTLISRGDAALSVTLTALTSTLAVVATPASILFWASLNPSIRLLIDSIGLDAADFFAQTVVTLALPLAAGMGLNHMAPRLARRLERPLRHVSFLVLLVFIGASLVGNWHHLRLFGTVVVPVAIAHNAAALGLGALAGRLAGPGSAVRRTLVFEVGIQNSGLGLVILLSHFAGLGGAALLTAAWGLWHIVSGLTLAGAFRLADQRRARLAVPSLPPTPR